MEDYKSYKYLYIVPVCGAREYHNIICVERYSPYYILVLIITTFMSCPPEKDYKQWTTLNYKVPPHLVDPLSEVIAVTYGGVMAKYLTHIITRDLTFRHNTGSNSLQENPEFEQYVRRIVHDEITEEFSAIIRVFRDLPAWKK